MNSVQKLWLHPCCRKQVGECQKETGSVEDSSLTMQHVGPLKGTCVDHCCLPHVIFHWFSGSRAGNIDSQVASPLVEIQYRDVLVGQLWVAKDGHCVRCWIRRPQYTMFVWHPVIYSAAAFLWVQFTAR